MKIARNKEEEKKPKIQCSIYFLYNTRWRRRYYGELCEKINHKKLTKQDEKKFNKKSYQTPKAKRELEWKIGTLIKTHWSQWVTHGCDELMSNQLTEEKKKAYWKQ